MKIYTKIHLDIDTWEVLEEESFEYDGPLVLCWDGDGADEGGGGEEGGPGDMGDPGEGGPSDLDAPSSTDDFGGWGDILGDYAGRVSVAETKAVTGFISNLLNIATVVLGPTFAIPATGWALFEGMISLANYFSPMLPAITANWGPENPNGPSAEGLSSEGGMSNSAIIERLMGMLANQKKINPEDPQQEYNKKPQTPQQIQMPEFSKWVAPPEQTQDPITITMLPYSVFNFPPDKAWDIYTQPKTSIWYT